MNSVVNTNKEVRFTVTIALESEGGCVKKFGPHSWSSYHHSLKLVVKNTSKKKSLKKLVA